MRKLFRENWPYLGIIFAFVVFFYLNYVRGSLKGDLPTFWSFSYHLIKTAFLERGDLHQWVDLVSGGVPFFAYAEFPLFDITFWALMIAPTTVAAAHASFFIHLLVAGLGMFLFMDGLLKDKGSAALSAIVFMYSGFFISHVSSNISYAYPFAYIPWIFLFASKALSEKNWALYSVITGIVFAFQILSGGSLIFLLTAFTFGFLLLVHSAGKRFVSRALKALFVGVVASVTALSLSAIKILPALEFLQASQRAGGVSYNEYLWSNAIPMNELFSAIVNGTAAGNVVLSRIGIFALLLVITSLVMVRKRYVLFALIIAASSILIATGSPYARLLYDFVPGFNGIRDITSHINSQFVFAAAMLAGAGASVIVKGVKDSFKIINGKRLSLVYILIIALIIGELFLGYSNIYKHSDQNLYEQIDNTETLKFLQERQKDWGIFRYHQLDENFVGPSLCWGSVPLGIPTMDWCSASVWINDYVGLTSIAAQYPGEAAKIWGMLNAKYIISDELVELEGLEFVGEFKTSDPSPANRQLPYVYENTEFLPRAYFVPNSIFILGTNHELEYSMILNEKFRPGNAVIMSDDALDELELEWFDYVILAKQPSDDEISRLRAFNAKGGVVVPDIFEGDFSINANDVASILEKISNESQERQQAADETELALQSQNKVVVETKRKNGFLVVSEKYYKFGGWKAQGNGEGLKILRANAAISSVYVDNYDQVVFTYSPFSFKLGSLISLASLLVVAGFIIRNKLRNKHKNQKEKEKSEP